MTVNYLLTFRINDNTEDVCVTMTSSCNCCSDDVIFGPIVSCLGNASLERHLEVDFQEMRRGEAFRTENRQEER